MMTTQAHYTVGPYQVTRSDTRVTVSVHGFPLITVHCGSAADARRAAAQRVRGARIAYRELLRAERETAP